MSKVENRLPRVGTGETSTIRGLKIFPVGRWRPPLIVREKELSVRKLTSRSIGRMAALVMLLGSFQGCAIVEGPATEQNLYEVPTEFTSLVSNAAFSTFEIGCKGKWRGSGWAINLADEGRSYLVTAFHVVESCIDEGKLEARNAAHSKFPVELVSFDGRYWDDSTVAIDEVRDLALLVTDRDLAGLDVEVEEARVGHWVSIVGYPAIHNGKEPLFTIGVVSGFNQYRMTTVNAATNSGNSGGPVLNSRGLVIGTLFASPDVGEVSSFGLVQPIRMHCQVILECDSRVPNQPTQLSSSFISYRY